MSSHETRFAKKMREKLEFDLERTRNLLTSGNLLVASDSGIVNIQCAKWIGHAGGLQFALDCIDLAEEELFGRAKDKKETTT